MVDLDKLTINQEKFRAAVFRAAQNNKSLISEARRKVNEIKPITTQIPSERATLTLAKKEATEYLEGLMKLEDKKQAAVSGNIKAFEKILKDACAHFASGDQELNSARIQALFLVLDHFTAQAMPAIDLQFEEAKRSRTFDEEQHIGMNANPLVLAASTEFNIPARVARRMTVPRKAWSEGDYEIGSDRREASQGGWSEGDYEIGSDRREASQGGWSEANYAIVADRKPAADPMAALYATVDTEEDLTEVRYVDNIQTALARHLDLFLPTALEITPTIAELLHTHHLARIVQQEVITTASAKVNAGCAEFYSRFSQHINRTDRTFQRRYEAATTAEAKLDLILPILNQLPQLIAAEEVRSRGVLPTTRSLRQTVDDFNRIRPSLEDLASDLAIATSNLKRDEEGRTLELRGALECREMVEYLHRQNLKALETTQETRLDTPRARPSADPMYEIPSASQYAATRSSTTPTYEIPSVSQIAIYDGSQPVYDNAAELNQPFGFEDDQEKAVYELAGTTGRSGQPPIQDYASLQSHAIYDFADTTRLAGTPGRLGQPPRQDYALLQSHEIYDFADTIRAAPQLGHYREEQDDNYLSVGADPEEDAPPILQRGVTASLTATPSASRNPATRPLPAIPSQPPHVVIDMSAADAPPAARSIQTVSGKANVKALKPQSAGRTLGGNAKPRKSSEGSEGDEA